MARLSHPAAVAAAALVASLSCAAPARAADFLAQEGTDLWRASKLPDVAVFGPDNRKVGTVSDVLVDHDGRAAAIVIGVGGFLGIGEKDVAVPFAQVRFTDQPVPGSERSPAVPDGAGPPAAGAPGAPADTGNSPNGGAPGGAAGEPPILGTPAATTTGNAVPGAIGMASVPTGPVGRAVRSTTYPDHGTVDLTADQLKAAPTFQFAK